MPFFRVNRTSFNTRTGTRLFWLVETEHQSVDELVDDIRSREIITVSHLITERGEAGFTVIMSRSRLGITLQGVESVETPDTQFLEKWR